MGKLRLREAKGFSQDHTARQWNRGDYNVGLILEPALGLQETLMHTIHIEGGTFFKISKGTERERGF